MLLRRLLSSRRRFMPLCSQSVRNSSSEKIVSSDLTDIDLSPMALHDMVLKDVSKWPSHTALECVLTGRKYSYSQLDVLSRRVASGFLRSGLKPGQVLSLALPNIPEFIIASLAALRAGLTITTINPLYGTHEILHQLTDSSTNLIITFPQKVADIASAISQIKGPQPEIAVIQPPSDSLPPGTKSFFELFNNEDTSPLDKVKVDLDGVALLLYSSGTTGLPKGVRLKHNALVSNIRQVQHPDIKPNAPTTEDHQDVATCLLPFFHIYGLMIGGFSFLSFGVKLVTLPKFDPQLFLKALHEHKSTLSGVVPPLIQFLGNHPAVKPHHLASIKTLMNGAAALSPTDAQKVLEKKKDIVIASGYGLTESSPVITAPKRGTTDLESVGCLVSNTQIKIIHPESGEIINPTTPGEICARGPQMMDGYHNNEEATNKTIIDGWLHTGDMGYVKDGRLFIVDRLKELIKVKGFQVAPMELEELLRTHPGVADVGVVAKPDPRLGEAPVAFVVPSGQKPTAEELKEFVASKVAEYKQLSDVIFIDDIPKNLTGKILRRQLKEKLLKS